MIKATDPKVIVGREGIDINVLSATTFMVQ
jgi:hypothetical protein